MGLIELHFHDADFDFSPSMVTGGDDAAALEDADGDDEDIESTGWASEPDDESGGGTGIGAVVALVVLVVLAALVGWKRRTGNADTDDIKLDA